MEYFGSGQRQVIRSFEYGHEFLGFIKIGNFLGSTSGKHTLRMFEDKVPRRIFGRKEQEVTEKNGKY
jgi:hypothetical protein